MRLIDADALRAEFTGNFGRELWHYTGVWAMIDNAPTIEAEPVKHGRWVELTECSNEGAYCSVCHKKVYKADYALCVKKNKVRSNYCPNCGAKMDLEKPK